MNETTIECRNCQKKVTLDVDDTNRYEGNCPHCDELIEGSLDDPDPEYKFRPGVGSVRNF